MNKAQLVFLFHMHQPYYIDIAENKAIMPWVRLHGIKGYYDIPYLISKLENTKITVNLVPSLIEQLMLYCEKKVSDLYLDLTVKPVAQMSNEEKLFLLDNFFSVNRQNFIEKNPNFKRLFELRGDSDEKEELLKRLSFFSDNDLIDLKALFNLSWFGFGARKEFPLLDDLIQKEKGYSEDDLTTIVDIQFKVLNKILPLYKRLFNEGRIEISISPYFHPILPLIIDSDIGKVALPDRPFPPRFSYPSHAKIHIDEGINLFKKVFGKNPSGMWPSEGSVSNDALEIIADCGIRWIATDEEILLKSGFENRQKFGFLYRLYNFRDKLYCFFRDRELSDKIGFVYYNMPVKDAIDDFFNHLKRILNFDNTKNPIVPIIFDGENPWEFYSNLGEDFLFGLFEAIERCNFAETLTFSEVLEKNESFKIDSIWPGSWINANFSIWIGHHEMNTAWSYLGRTAQFFEKKSLSFQENELIDKARKELLVAEGSDWFWWYGDDFHVKGQENFDFLFLKHLSNVYRLLGEEEPVFLKNPIKKTKLFSHPALPVSLISPDIDGRISNYFEWSGSGIYSPAGKGGAMFEGENPLKRILFGQDLSNIYFLIELSKDLDFVELFLQDKHFFRLKIPCGKGSFELPVHLVNGDGVNNTDFRCQVAIDGVIELKIPSNVFNFDGRDTLKFAVKLKDFKEYRIPQFGFFETGMTFPPVKKFLIEF